MLKTNFLFAAVLLVAGAIAACGSPFEKYEPPPTNTALPDLSAYNKHQMGDAVFTTSADEITVFQTAPAQSKNKDNTPPPGGSFYAARVKECAGLKALSVNPTAWSVRLVDSTLIHATSSTGGMSPSPAFEKNSYLSSKSCAAGWVYFPLPGGAKPMGIFRVYADFYWEVAGSATPTP